MSLWNAIAQAIADATGQPFSIARQNGVGGGCINEAVTLEGRDGRRFFVKLNGADKGEMFAAEAEGLEAIAATGAIAVPAVVALGEAAGRAFLVLEQLDLGRGGEEAMARLGHDLAALHRHGADRFGWHRDNTIGATPQHNDWCDDWTTFWREQRLGFQLDLARHNGYGGALQRKGAELLARLDELLDGHRPRPSLLHGDLWSGNAAVLADGRPVIFDPAVYHGDREADLAMTELFGGFGPAFRSAYEAAWPLDPGYSRRKTLYNLYHILNHLNLFGGGYLGQAEAMIDRLLGR